MLDHAAVQSGRWAFSISSREAPEDSQAIEVLQRAGYAIYLRQDIMRLVRTRLTIQSEPILCPAEARDQWGVQQLYMNTAPRLAQLAEGQPRVYRSRQQAMCWKISRKLWLICRFDAARSAVVQCFSAPARAEGGAGDRVRLEPVQR
ncbi:MAG: hypothetical protein U0559_05395 [Anaerolineae bacterium]